MASEAVYKGPAVDVSGLPAVAFDYRSPLWWGNTLLLFIETAMFGILISVYFAVAMNTDPFPPNRVDRLPVIFRAAPDMTLPLIGLAILLASLVPGILLDLAARKRQGGLIKIFIPITLAFNVAALIVRYYEFDSLHFKWNDNAYGSITWMILGIHMFHLWVMLCEDLYLAIWTFKKDLDDKHAVDLTVMAIYWYWIVGMWLLLFSVVYIFPRVY